MMWRVIWAGLGTLVVMFWNVENYFDPFDDPLKNDNEFTPRAERHWTWSRFEAKRDGIAQTILAAGDVWGELPAVVGLCEVENRMVVSQLVRKTMLEELGYGFVHRESPDERGIDVALLYRKDRLRVLAVDSLRVPGVVTRDILYVKMIDRTTIAPLRSAIALPSQKNARSTQYHPLHSAIDTAIPDESVILDDDRTSSTDEGILHVFVVHLPSKRGGARASADRRDAALGVLQGAVDSLLALDSTSRILVMGDFNDTDPSVAGLREPPLATSGYPPGTLKYHGRWERIDHFFLSPALSPPGGRAEMRIFAPPFLLEADKAWLGQKPRRTYVGPRYNGGLSDHLPICLRLNQPPVDSLEIK